MEKSQRSHQNQKILIVEDEPAYLQLLRDQLTAMGYQVMEAIDGKTGLAIAKKEKPDLILLDIRMPVMDGMTMLHELRRGEDREKTNVIMLTNLEPDDTIVDGIVRDQPSYYYVKSDIQLSDLLAKIETVLAE